jgi:hypothetical protein
MSLPPPLPDAPAARPVLAALQARLVDAGIAFRPPPAEPVTCCGRGCNGCVWESYFAALAYWRERAAFTLYGVTAD